MPGVTLKNRSGYAPQIEWGEPGARWTNATGAIWYQFHVNWVNTCGVCAQYDGAVKSGSWPLPLHRHCRCTQTPVMPGEPAPEPFTDFRAKIESLPHDQQVAAVGAASYRLIRQGVVEWEDVVTPYRVRTLREVVAIKGLTAGQMTAAGVPAAIAETAFAAVHTPVHRLVAQARKDLVAKLEGAGLDRAQIARLAAEGIASRVGIQAGPSGPQRPKARPPDADRLRAFLANFPSRKTATPTPGRPGPIKTEIGRAAKVAADLGVASVPLGESRAHLEAMCDDPFERMNVIAAYDTDEDLIVFNPDHDAWNDPKAFLAANPGFYSTLSRDHLVRHEVGHAKHYRSLGEEQRKTLWLAELTSEQQIIATKVSRRAAHSVREFVADVYAGLLEGLEFSSDVMALYASFQGPVP
jgi:hypothetical protein